MNCFNHPDKPAIGLCKSCCKGLCGDCAAIVPNGLACRNACEGRVILLNKIIDNNQRVISTSNIQVRYNNIFIVLFGLVACLMDIILFMKGHTASHVLLIMGLFCVGFGTFRLMRKTFYYPTVNSNEYVRGRPPTINSNVPRL